MEVKRSDRGSTIEVRVSGSIAEVDDYIANFMEDWDGYMPTVERVTIEGDQKSVTLTRWDNSD